MVTAARYAPSNGWSIAVGSVPFVEFVTAHRHGHATVPPDLDGRDWRRTLALRATDTAVHQQTDLMMLSVAADRIAHPAMPCAALLARLARDERVAARRQPDDTARTAGGSSGGRARRSPAWPSARARQPSSSNRLPQRPWGSLDRRMQALLRSVVEYTEGLVAIARNARALKAG